MHFPHMIHSMNKHLHEIYTTLIHYQSLPCSMLQQSAGECKVETEKPKTILYFFFLLLIFLRRIKTPNQIIITKIDQTK